jgi:hypothetical protein
MAIITSSNKQRSCVRCGQALPSMSKLTQQRVANDEADTFHWAGERNSDSTVTVDMCLQCQITRSERAKHPDIS